MDLAFVSSSLCEIWDGTAMIRSVSLAVLFFYVPVVRVTRNRHISSTVESATGDSSHV